MPACFCLPACWSVIQPRSQPCLHPYFALHHQLLASLSPLPLPVILTSIHLHSLTAGNKLFLILSNSEIVSCVWVPPLILTDTYISPARGYAFIWNHVACVISCYYTKNADGTALMSSGWCDHEKMKRHIWQPTEEHRKDQISHQQPGISVRKNVYSSAARLSWTEERCTLTEFITSAMLYAQLYWCWMFLWCWRVAAPCYRCQLPGHQKRFPPDRISTNE